MTKEARSTTVAAGGNPASEDDALDSENNPAPSGADTALGGGAKHTKRAEDATTPISSASIPENITAGGHALPNNWLMRIVLIWSGYAISAFAGNAASYSSIWFVTESTASPLALAALYVLAFLPMGILSPFGGVVAESIGTSLFFCVDGAFIVTLGIATILPKSVRALN